MARLLLLITDLRIGGTPTVVRELAIRLRDERAHVEVACLAGEGPVAGQLRSAGVTCTPLSARGAWDIFRTTRACRSLIVEHRIDTVLSFLVHANVVAARATRGVVGVRLFQSIQTTQPRPRWHWWAQRRVAAVADRVIVPSPSVRQAAMSRCHIPSEKIVVIPNAVDLDRFAGLSHSHEPRRRIGFVGRLDPVKRVEKLLDAVRLLPTDFTLWVFGDGEQRSRLESIAATPGLAGRVHFAGEVADNREPYARIDLLVLPSLAEGFGLVLIEAMAAGVPVIGADVDGIRDVIDHDKNGLLVDAGNPRALADAIARLAGEAELARRLIEGGRACVGARYGFSPVLRAYRAALNLPVSV